MTAARQRNGVAPDRARLRLRLYVAGQAPHSVAARANLEILLSGVPAELEVVDVFEHPGRAVADDILVTPTLLKFEPAPACRVIGNLSHLSRVRRLLGLPEAA